jgi:hypothetical protein
MLMIGEGSETSAPPSRRTSGVAAAAAAAGSQFTDMDADAGEGDLGGVFSPLRGDAGGSRGGGDTAARSGKVAPAEMFAPSYVAAAVVPVAVCSVELGSLCCDCGLVLWGVTRSTGSAGPLVGMRQRSMRWRKLRHALWAVKGCVGPCCTFDL